MSLVKLVEMKHLVDRVLAYKLSIKFSATSVLCLLCIRHPAKPPFINIIISFAMNTIQKVKVLSKRNCMCNQDREVSEWDELMQGRHL